MESMEFLATHDDDSDTLGMLHTVRMETDALPPVVELGRKLLAKAQEGDAEAVRELMKQGAPFTTDWLGTSAIHWACQLNHYDVAELLLKAGISKDARNKVDRTPLHVTAQEGHVQILKLLLSYGVDVDASDMLRMTPLHWAAENGHEECVKLLLEHGADPVAVNKFDKTPDQIAFENDRLDICHIIQEYAENPLRHVHRKEAKERQKQAAAAHKAALEQEKANKNPIKLITNGDKILKMQGQELKEVRILKLPKKRGQLRGVNENIIVTNGLPTTQSNSIPHPLPTIQQHQTQLSSNDNATEKTLAMLQAHGITMLPNDETTIVASAVQSGQKVVLTEAGKMALNLTERPITLKTPNAIPVKNILKLPPEILKGKKVITIRADQLINMKNEKKVIIQTDKKFKPIVSENAHKINTLPAKPKLEVLVTKKTINNQTHLTSSIIEKPPDPDPTTLCVDRLLNDSVLEDVTRINRSEGGSTSEEKTEIQRIKQELEEMKRQMKILQEQYLQKEQEAMEYKRIVEMLRSNQ